ncbi:MAG TPA: type VII secretion target [Actinoplanes sp.]|nr:type VII secretion target [Actinoplanes sp.]
MQDLNRRLADAADLFADTARLLRDPGPGPRAFGAEAGGLPGRLGRDLHDAWVAALAARAGEAVDTAARLHELGEAVRLTARRYAESDDRAASRLRREQ